VSQVGTEAEPVVEVVIDLVGPTPFTLTSSAGGVGGGVAT
jgi:hypothetical protein